MFTLGLSGTGGCGIGISTGIDQQVNDVRPVGEVTGPIRDEMECGAATTSGLRTSPSRDQGCPLRAALPGQDHRRTRRYVSQPLSAIPWMVPVVVPIMTTIIPGCVPPRKLRPTRGPGRTLISGARYRADGHGLLHKLADLGLGDSRPKCIFGA